jgi:G3E family GTPase
MTATQHETARLSVSIITGFLGSGKTTLLNRLLQHRSMRDALVIINELGEIGIDHLLVSTPSENLVLLNNGCLCCVLRGDLAQTFAELYEKRARGDVPSFGQVLVETTGLADPVPVIQSIVTDPAIAPRYRLGAVVTLVDAVHGEGQLERHPESVKQVAVADRLLISKMDLVPDAQVCALQRALGDINPSADVLMALDVSDPDQVFRHGVQGSAARADDVERWLRVPTYRRVDRFPSVPRPQVGDRHDGRVRTFSLIHDRPIRAPALAFWMNMIASFHGRGLLRVKGLLNVEGDPVAIHVVQTIVHEPIVLRKWPDDDRRSRIVFITRDIESREIAKTLDALSFTEPPASPDLRIDPAAYERFVRAAKTFVG